MNDNDMVLVPTRWIVECMNDNLSTLETLSDESKHKLLQII